MKKELAPYSLALRLKALGFDFSVIAWSDVYTNHIMFMSPDNWCDMNKHKECISRPIFSQCFRWFREKYNCHHTIHQNKKYVGIAYSSVVNFSIDEFDTYEEAELACLEKLLEIVESKSE